MQYSEATIARYRNAWKRRDEKALEAQEHRRLEAWEEAGRLAEILARQPEVSKVVLFGSTTIPHRFHEDSDIDLAVWGLAPEKYFAVLSDLERKSEYSIDLIPAEDARSSIQKKIETGEVLFERKGT
ncbi:MAG: hypothetical protein GF344_05970 [Chitinivibrionales bacterium]|nr:hypothetical protein [Chitinivibrionales bacterium]